MKRFVNFLQWVTDDAEAKIKNLYHPLSKIKTWEAQKGDFWRLLIHKSILRGVEPRFVEARILSCDMDCGVWDGTFTDTTKRAVVRNQFCELYVEFTIKINGISTAENYKQFALTRANGAVVLDTVNVTAATAEEYAVKIKEFYEGYQYTKVFVYRRGTLLTIRAFMNDNFRFVDEEFSLGIGDVATQNTNNPSLFVVFAGTVNYPARNSWNVVIENVEEGNIFELNDARYEVGEGDTAESVKKALIGDNERFIIDESEIISIKTTKGFRYVTNTNRPTLELTYFDTVSSKDRYIVTVGSSVRTGNTYQIQASGKPLVSKTALATDTASTIKAALVAVSGYYEVTAGTVPTWAAIVGNEKIENLNEPSLSLTDLQTIAAENKDKYRIVIGSDVTKGNKYVLGDEVYIATSADTANTVGIALGLTSAVDYVEIKEGGELNGYAVKGNKYTDEDIADIVIVQQPRVLRSNQLFLEIDFDLDADKTYCIQLADWKRDVVLGYSNLIDVVLDSDETNIVEVADEFEAMDYEYFERTTQIMRLPVYLRTPLQRSSENRTKLLDGGYRRANTTIEETTQLITHAEDANFHETLAAWLKHTYVWINDESYFSEGEYAETIVSELSRKKQAKSNLVVQRERSNKTTYFGIDSKPTAYGTVLLHGFSHGLTIILKNNTFEPELQEGKNVLPAAEYCLIVYNDGDERKLRIAPGGYELWSGVVPKRSLVRFAKLMRVESGQTLEIQCEKVAALSVNYIQELEGQTAEVISYVDEYFESTDFNDDFNNDFNS
ncbi:hypothetical protein [Runella salmonicolor]|uniref:Phage tail protein n=1 Tax=Runella salmonicolor TaxID=2950278 RepID=A0ABT1FSV9_9BACT|nr:hypothetical protein [Runella salmonicolor]MCP1384806.1 hypothetical protein [Runella salmonicolor]